MNPWNLIVDIKVFTLMKLLISCQNSTAMDVLILITLHCIKIFKFFFNSSPSDFSFQNVSNFSLEIKWLILRNTVLGIMFRVGYFFVFV